MLSKTCSKCRRVLPLHEFYAGETSWCKSCRRQQSLDYYYAHRERCLQAAKEWQRAHPDRVRVYHKNLPTEVKTGYTTRHRWKHPERAYARSAVTHALNAGRLVRGPCEVCEATERIEAHHDDYGKPLEVRWLCHEHHTALTVKEREVAYA